MMKTTIILGSGVSFYSGIPNVNCITSLMLDINKNSTYFNGNQKKRYIELISRSLNEVNVKSCQLILKIIKDDIDRFYKMLKSNHITNYEDIYFVVCQITDSFYEEYENPATIRLIRYLVKKVDMKISDFKEIMNNLKRYIEFIVWNSIDKEINKFNQFEILNEINNTFNLHSILSLNHDLILEKYLNANKIEYDDGFGIVNCKKIEEWIGFKNSNSKLKLCKLHGSVNWFEYRFSKSEDFYNIVKAPYGISPLNLESIDNSLLYYKEGYTTPTILIGTFNKMWGYLSGMPEIMYNEMKKYLSDSEYLIISGYGFGDKGINTRLYNWLNFNTSKKMIIIHPNENYLIENSRGIFKIMFYYYNNSKLKIIEKKFEDINIKDITNSL